VASALRHGLVPSLHSDYRVTEIEPLRSVQTAVTRTVADGGAVLGPDERVDVMSALAAVTSGAAWQLHSEHEVGTVKVGCFADLAVLSADPTSVPPEEISAIEVEGTLFGGQFDV
jgi:predicted amidohydrolase YtcJ